MLFKTVLSLATILATTFLTKTSSTPLDDYVWRPDPNYQWVDLGVSISGAHATDPTKGWTGHFLNVTSQRWLTDADTTRSVWWHVLCVIIPDGPLKYNRNASMYVTGGGNEGTSLPDSTSEDILVAAALAMGSGSITGTLFQVPNEHMLFHGDPIQKQRSEDAIIAYTWAHFLDYPDQPEWLVRFPMVKSVLRAMDAMTEYVAKVHPELNSQLDYYTIAGASKRGWTTWLMGAVDPERVVAIVPMVLDAINFVKFMHHQYESYNGFSFALADYYDMNITERIDDPSMPLLQAYEDPYFYFDRLNMPKLVVNAVADEFQQPDDTHYWWKDLSEPKHFMMVPNAEHSLATAILQVVPAISTWISHLLEKTTVPSLTWELDNVAGEITVFLDPNASQKVKNVKKYYAKTCQLDGPMSLRRDFRIATADVDCECGYNYEGTCGNLHVFWSHETLTEKSPFVYSATHPAPEKGWAAFFIQVTYESATDDGKWQFGDHIPGFIPRSKPGELVFTSEVNIVPDVFPFADCSGLGCKGTLV